MSIMTTDEKLKTPTCSADNLQNIQNKILCESLHAQSK